MNSLELTRPLVFFDFETTGLNKQADRIIEVCMIKVLPNGEEQILNCLINPEMPIPPKVTEIHGIKDEDVEGKPTFKELSEKILNFMEGCDLCGFNIGQFDIPIIESELARANVTWSRGERHVIDVKNIYHKLEPRNLTAAYLKYCGKTLDEGHRAEMDVRATMEILEAQLQKHDVLPKNVPSLKEFTNDPSWIDKDGKFKWENGDAVININPHKGMPLRELVTSNPGFLRWILSKDFSLEVKNIATEALNGRFPQQVKG